MNEVDWFNRPFDSFNACNMPSSKWIEFDVGVIKCCWVRRDVKCRGADQMVVNGSIDRLQSREMSLLSALIWTERAGWSQQTHPSSKTQLNWIECDGYGYTDRWATPNLPRPTRNYFIKSVQMVDLSDQLLNVPVKLLNGVSINQNKSVMGILPMGVVP